MAPNGASPPSRTDEARAAAQAAGHEASPLRARAFAAQRAGEAGRAFALWQAHLRAAPQDAEAWSNLGALLRAQGHARAAVLHQRRAAALAPDRPEILANLANALADLDETTEALALRREAAARAPGSPPLRLGLAQALRRAGEEAAAEAEARAILAARPGTPEAAALLRRAPLLRGDWGAAFPQARRAVADAGPDRPLFLAPEGDALDLLAALRFLPGLQARCGAAALIPAPPPLHGLIAALSRGQAPGPPLRPLAQDAAPPPGAISLPRAALAAAAGAAPGAAPPFRLPLRRPHRPQPHAPLRLGLAPFAEGEPRFSTSFAWLVALALTPGVEALTLACGPAAGRLSALPEAALAPAMPGDTGDMADLAAVAAECDLVIAAPGAEAALAAAAGVETLILVSRGGHWSLGTGAQSPFFPGARLIRPAPGADGAAARRAMIEQAAAILRARLADRGA